MIKLIDILDEIKIVSSNIYRYQNYDDFKNDNPQLHGMHVMHPGLFKMYDNSGGLFRFNFKGKKYLGGIRGHIADENNKPIDDTNIIQAYNQAIKTII